MPRNIVIVESPTKAKTIGKYLGSDYEVRASMGHVRDLPKTTKDGIGVHIDGGVSLAYVVMTKAKKFISELKKAAADAPAVYLATDPDREGEAIAWHILEAAKIPASRANRVAFTEITQSAIREAFANPRPVDDNLVNAQQARRAVDRIVGYKLSPLLWRKIGGRTSAGRVQSSALRLVVDREREIRSFLPREYWTVEALLEANGATFKARTPFLDRERFSLADELAANEVVAVARGAAWRVTQVKRQERRRSPAPPFITSTLQQEAARKLGLSAKRTMAIAQQLYEGIELGAEGSVGLITYMRTDSPHVAESALAEQAKLVRERYGAAYALDKPRRFKAKAASRAQEAHEAIRPTDVRRDPDSIGSFLDRDQRRLYTLIWQRAVASQMAQAVFDAVAVDLDAGGKPFRATGQTVRFEGFMRVYTEGRDEPSAEEDEGVLPDLAEGQVVDLRELEPVQHFTEPPPRYTEASLVKALEELGIGRPSTYAQIMSTLHDRKYVVIDRKRLTPTDLGIVICDFLAEVYPKVVDLEFTAEMETELDKIAEGTQDWAPMVRLFWTEVSEITEKATEKAERPSEATEIPCPECGTTTGAKMQKRWGRYGWFLSCERYPECKARMKVSTEGSTHEPRPEPEQTDIPCPLCSKPMLKRQGRYGEFLGCADYPSCKGVRSLEEAEGPEITCPKCGQGRVVRKRTKRRRFFYGCNRYPECDFAMWEPPLPTPCPECSGPLVPEGDTQAKCLKCERVFETSSLPAS